MQLASELFRMIIGIGIWEQSSLIITYHISDALPTIRTGLSKNIGPFSSLSAKRYVTQ